MPVPLGHKIPLMFPFPLCCDHLFLQRHVQNMLFSHNGFRGRNTPLPFVAYARKATILVGTLGQHTTVML
jgi:hypothetical protein